MDRIKLPSLTRSAQIEASQIDAESRTITFPFSSTFPVDRYFGSEVLSHDAGAADLSRLNDGAPLLLNHDPNQLIGVVERAWVQDGRGYATAKFSSSPMAQQAQRDVADGIMRNASFGYRVMELTAGEQRDDGQPQTFTAERWMPFEVSLVSIPADPTVGIGRAANDDEQEVPIRAPSTIEPQARAPEPEPAVQEVAASTPSLSSPETMTDLNIEAVRSEAAAAERTRNASITALGSRHGMDDLARQFVESGRSVEEFRTAILDKLGAKQEPIDQSSGSVDLNAKEQREYSLVRAINAAITGNWSDAGLEREVSAEIERKSGRATSGFYMPHNLEMRAPYAVGASSTGGALVATNLLASNFIEVLRNNALIMNMGPSLLTGLVGNVSLPRQTAATATYWVTEASSLTEAEATFDTVTLSPKQIGARSQYSRLALAQTTPDIEQLVRNDLAKVMALGIDLAAINGSGSSGQPTGILNTSGIGSVAMGTNGAAFTDGASGSTSGLDQLISLESKLDIANALNGNLYYLTNAKVIAKLKALKNAYGEYLWTASDGVTTTGTPGGVNGYGVMRSNQVPATLTKGSGTALSALIFGNFSELLIGMWGALEILPNPYGSGYNAGSVDIRAMQTCDIAVKHAASFAAITDIIA